MTGKEKCRLLKDIRKKTAEENGIPFETTECGFKGECKGTCPKCEAELKYINEQLERKRKIGKAAIAVAMSASLIFAAGCTPDTEAFPEYTLEGDVPYVPENQCDPEEEPILLEGDVVYVPELEGDVPYVPEDQCDPEEEPILLEGDVVYVPEEE